MPSDHRDQQIRLFLLRLRTTHPDFVFMFTHGACYHLHRILCSIWPEAELWHQPEPGHVFSKIGDYWYDIRGRRIAQPKGARLVTAARLGRPDQWKDRLALVIDAYAVARMVSDRMRREKRRRRPKGQPRLRSRPASPRSR